MHAVSIVNFRDLGGIACANGQHVRPKRLLRSGELVGVSSADKKTLIEDYDLRCIVDFRTKSEREIQPDDTFEGVAYVPIDLFGDMETSAPAQEILSKLTSLEQVDSFMKSAYEMLILEKSAQEGYQQFLKVLLGQAEGATLNHCSAGKDRTGVGIAIALTILGASRDDIMVDFMRTNESRKLSNSRVAEVFASQGVSESQIKVIEAALCVKESYLETAYAKATELFGSFEGFIKDGLGVDTHAAHRLQEMYLE